MIKYILLCNKTNSKELDQRSLWRAEGEEGGGHKASRGASESGICSARNPAVCAQIGCYLSAAGDRAHRGPRARASQRIYQHSRRRHPTHIRPTTYKREMRTLPILASKRSPEASFKLPTAFLLLTSHIRLPQPHGYPRFPSPRVSSDYPTSPL